MIGTPEFQFFCITIASQRETGGNLAETLANLSEVLRKRAQMKLKIRAMSSEAKASAYIVGALPFFVFGIVWTMNPEYLAGFFHEQRLIITGLGGLVWMRSEEHTSELQSLMRTSYAVFCLIIKNDNIVIIIISRS